MSYVTKSITKFRGMNQSKVGVALDPQWALSSINVIPDTVSGALEKFRKPVALSDAITDSGPDQFGMFSNALTGLKQVICMFGQSIYSLLLDSFAATLLGTSSDYSGPTPMSTVVSDNLFFFANGVTNPLKWTGTEFEAWGIQQGQIPTIGVPFGTGITLATGRMYRVSYKNSVTGHVGTASDASASTGAIANKTIPVTIPAFLVVGADNKIDSARIYSTLDGGSDFFFNTEIAGPFPAVFNDDVGDASLDQSERAPLINDMPPKAKFLAKWGARIFMFNLPGEANPQGIAYTGYNRILVGRPEESCPPGNRLLLETGADAISGGGVIAAGVIAFDISDKMYMFRGQPEDITTNAPVEFTLYLQQLPWQIGCSGHFTIQSTPYGLVWRTPDRQVRLFNGTDRPEVISGGVEPILKSITYGTEQNERSAYWSFNEKNWYVLAVAVDGSTALNLLLIFDLEPGEDNVGIFTLDIGVFQSLGILEMVSGEQKLVVGQGGQLRELAVASKCINGVTQNPTATTDTLGAIWQSGYFGNENPQQVKFMRFSRLSADTDGFSIKRYLVNDEDSTMAQPEIIDVEPLTDPMFATDMETRRMSIEIQFPPIDKDAAVQLLTNTYIPGAER